jgi:hypothetical protein
MHTKSEPTFPEPTNRHNQNKKTTKESNEQVLQINQILAPTKQKKNSS